MRQSEAAEVNDIMVRPGPYRPLTDEVEEAPANPRGAHEVVPVGLGQRQLQHLGVGQEEHGLVSHVHGQAQEVVLHVRQAARAQEVM